jgi:transposase
MPTARQIHTLPDEERKALETLYRKTNNADVRTRCQMILFSSRGYSVAEIAKLTLFEEDAVLYWFNRYEADKLNGLEDRPRSGRPPKSNLPM